MPCFHFKNAVSLAERFVPIHYGRSVQHNPGEVLIGVVPECPGSVDIKFVPSDQPTTSLQAELNDAIGGGAGDWIKTLASPFAKLIGKKNCSICEARRLATNAYAKLKVKYGQGEALCIMKELWGMSYGEKADPNAILVKLQGYLND